MVAPPYLEMTRRPYERRHGAAALQTVRVHPCPCCGYKTLPSRGDYDLCPVCWWEDEGTGPWEYSGPNNETLDEAQQAFLADGRPYRQRPGKVRPPKAREARDPGWQPYAPSAAQLKQIAAESRERQRGWAAEARRAAEEVARNPEGRFKAYNRELAALWRAAPTMRHGEVKAALRALDRAHNPAGLMVFNEARLELLSRMLADENYYRGHPFRTALWLARFARPGRFKRCWAEVRGGGFHFAG